jgi:catechol 2,3-dioxygenase
MTETVLDNAVTRPVVPTSTRLGPVHIAVTGREPALAVWRDVVGLEVIEESDDAIRLGAGGETLVVLETDATRRALPATAGLYHVAIHVPSRADLAAFLARALKSGIRVSPTDHLVSEAIYLWDSDGNGIEITFETPWRGQLTLNGEGGYAVTADGRPHSGREPIDVTGLLAELGETDSPERMPAGTRIGHIHVHVGDLDKAMGFYRDVLGFGGQLLSHKFGMGDVTVGYQPHIVAFNVWQGHHVSQPPEGTAGLRHFRIVLPDAESLAAMRGRLADAGARLVDGEDGLATADPWGNPIRIGVA